MISNKQINRIVSLIIYYYAPDQILLFGSLAKGMENSRSDIDLIVLKDTPQPKEQRGRELSDIFSHFPFKVDLLFLTKKELETRIKRESSFFHSIWPEAKNIYKKGQEKLASDRK